MALLDDIQEHIELVNKERDRRLSRFVRLYQDIILSYGIQIANNLERTADYTAALVVIGDITRELEYRVSDVVADDILEMFEEELRTSIETYRIIAGQNVFSGADSVILEQLIDLNLETVDRIASSHIGKLEDAVIANVLTNQPIDPRDIAGEMNDAFARNIQTELDTGLAVFNRTVNMYKAEQLEDEQEQRFLYVGPIDSITRPFCLAVLATRNPPVFSKSEIENMNNGQIPNVAVSCGGYNCRHEWVYVPPRRRQEIVGDYRRFKSERKIIDVKSDKIEQKRREGGIPA